VSRRHAIIDVQNIGEFWLMTSLPNTEQNCELSVVRVRLNGVKIFDVGDEQPARDVGYLGMVRSGKRWSDIHPKFPPADGK